MKVVKTKGLIFSLSFYILIRATYQFNNLQDETWVTDCLQILNENISQLKLTKESSIIKNEGCKDKRAYIFIVILSFDMSYWTA
jgi:hypothetical protein